LYVVTKQAAAESATNYNMRTMFQGNHAIRVSLLLFQVTAFLVPWLIVLWLSFENNISGVARYSYLLALFSPLALLIASPSRNFLISTNMFSEAQAVGLRYLLLAVGLILAVIGGGALGMLWLAIAVYLSKVAEFFFDIAIARYIRESKPDKLLMHGGAKLAAIAVGALIAVVTGDLLITLFALAVLFVLFALRRNSFYASLPAAPYTAVKHILPLSLSALIFSVYFNIPRYLLGGDHHEGLLAIFTISSFLLTVLLVVNNAFCQADLHRWSAMLEEGEISPLKRSLWQAVLRGGLLYAALQLFQLPWLSELFWQAHNNLQAQNTFYPTVFHAVLALGFGPLLFSIANYLLITLKQHKVLLSFTLANALCTGGLCLLAYYQSGFIAVLVVTCLSGLVHFTLCYRRFSISLRQAV